MILLSYAAAPHYKFNSDKARNWFVDFTHCEIVPTNDIVNKYQGIISVIYNKYCSQTSSYTVNRFAYKFSAQIVHFLVRILGTKYTT